MLRIATRKSELALWQANDVCQRLQRHSLSSTLLELSTRGDEIIDQPLAKIGGKGLFVKNLQRAMLTEQADMAVHSMKDMPADFPEGLHLGAVLEREDPTDCFVSNRFDSLDNLPDGAVVGTCSMRRQCQLLERRPDLSVKSLRGNINTRLKKLDDGEYDAIILASAGLIRLGLHARMTERLAPDVMLPACGQGIIGIECKTGDSRTNDAIALLHDTDAADRVTAERSLNARLGGSCTTPIAAYAELNADQLTLNALVGMPDGSIVVRASASDSRNNAAALGRVVAEQLLAAGAEPVLAQFNPDVLKPPGS